MDLLDYLKHIHQIELTSQQLNAVNALSGPVCVISCPGSGKTTVTVIRLANLIVNGGVNPEQILALTFSKASAADMNNRFQALFPKLSRQVKFATIHSFAFHIIRHFQQLSGIIYQFIDSSSSSINKRHLLNQFYLELTETYPTDDELDNVSSQMSLLKNLMIEPHHTKEIKEIIEEDPDLLIQIYKQYEAFKESRYLLDYDDLLTTAFNILKNHDYLLNFYQQRYQHIQVDEAQDTSKIQFELIKLVAAPHNQLFLVGDDDQSIYAFRGAYPKQLLDFKQTYPEANMIYMAENFRSSKEIVKASAEFIKANTKRYKKHIHTHNEKGSKPILHHFQTEGEQLSYLMDHLKQAKNLNDIAILYRQNVSAIPLIEQFEREGIPFRLQEGKISFFTHPIVKDIEAILTLAYHPTDAQAFKRVSKLLYLSAGTVSQALSQSESPYLDYLIRFTTFKTAFQREKVRQFRQNMVKILDISPNRTLAFILNTLDYESYLVKKGFLKDENDDRIYTQGVAVIETLRTIAIKVDTHQAFLERLTYLKNLTMQNQLNDQAVHLLTFHASKGLEFESVFLIDCMNGITPPQTAITEWQNKEFEAYEEERRLFYVAMTRAKSHLELISVAQKHQLLFTRSNFFQEVSKLVLGNGPNQESPSKDSIKKSLATLRQGLISSDSVDLSPYQVGVFLKHKLFGIGQIIEREGEIAKIKFESDERRISLKITVLNGNVSLIDKTKTP